MTDERQIAALREEIRRSGARTRRLRRLTGWSVALALLAVVAIDAATSIPRFSRFDYPADAFDPVRLLQQFLFDAVFVVVLAGCLALSIAATYREWRCRALGRQLAQLSDREQADLLVPLSGERGDTSKIVAAIERQWPRRSEIAPSVADARGDEASPAEGAP